MKRSLNTRGRFASMTVVMVLVATAVHAQEARQIRKEVEVKAPVAQVWKSWSTAEGLGGFFAPKAVIDLKVHGAFEILFFPDAPKGQRGAEDLNVLAFVPGEMLAFEWNHPPQFTSLRGKKTFVVVQMRAVAPDRTVVTLTHLGWQHGGEWDQAYQYFGSAWDTVLERLKRRHEKGVMDWKAEFAPPKGK